ncbi:Seven TM Receptor [Aphelenchoides besseyi]|nr:Seven TM Receptor [Aphelenchoides besseyi]KAI6223222.1 Seven TM Receptor [Aphelenchoides besseyi]
MMNLFKIEKPEGHQIAYSLVMWTLGAVALLLNSLTVYLILRKSNSDIAGYKNYILNFTIADILFSCLLSFFLQPVAIVPGGGMQILGLLKVFGGFAGHVQFTLIAFIFSHSIVGLNYCFVYRYASLCDIGARRLLEKPWYRFALIGSGELACFSIALLIFDMRVPEQHFRNVTLQRFPYQSHLLENAVYFGYDYKNSPHANIFLWTALLLAPLSCGLNFLCAALIIKRLQQYRRQLTNRTYHLHMKLLVALLMQTTIPLFLFILPIMYIFLSTILLLSGPLTNTLTRYIPVVALALHPIINPCITIFFIEPYRRAVTPEFLLKRRDARNTTMTITNVTVLT